MLFNFGALVRNKLWVMNTTISLFFDSKNTKKIIVSFSWYYQIKMFYFYYIQRLLESIFRSCYTFTAILELPFSNLGIDLFFSVGS